MSENKQINEGLKEVGKSLLTLANLMLVLFLFNTYMQKDDFSIIGVVLSLYCVITAYYFGYRFINKGNEKC
ncbi:MAG: hypothetical protein U9N02_02675 [Campylobacterota bacterium]|nr:hypothetical protein [Campylobacterota bacterium]